MNICRTKFSKNIVTEFVPPADKKSGNVMIFCSGVPGHPDKDDVLMFWAEQGYWTFFPRYRGAWESGGTFLKQSLEHDVLDVIGALQRPFKNYWTGKTYQVIPKSITIVGSSFGGPAAILATIDPRVSRAVCISPVVDWRAENKTEPLVILYKLLRKLYPNIYRLRKKYWNKLGKENFYNPLDSITKLDPRKILIFHAQDDKIVRYKPVAKFAEILGCDPVTFKRGGHLSSSMLIQKKHSQRVKKFIERE